MPDLKTRLTHEGAALISVLLGTFQLTHRMREVGKRTGHIAPSGAGIWGFLNSLAVDGPQTVPALARQRPVSRQYMQTVANDAVAEGLVEFIDNPGHKRSKLVALTDKGRAHYMDLTRSLAGIATELAQGLEARELEQTVRVLDTITKRLARLKVS